MGERTSEYWQERFRQMEESQHDTSVQTVQEIEQEFRRAEQALDGKINAWYQRFAANNGISMVEARRLLNSDELEEFRWDVQDYIKYGRENGINQQWAKQLENASAKVHISRLEALKVQTQQEIEKLYGNYHDSIDEHIANLYTSGYYHTAYEVQRGIGVGWQMQSFNPEKVNDIIHKPWAVDGRNFSERIWTDKTKLINNMHDSLTRMCITGESPDRAIREISQNMKVSRSQAARIVQTESAAFSAKAQETCFSDLDVEEFEVVETLDSHTCPTCGEMDGKHFQMKDYKIGVTVPPFHPNCRGCTCPYFNDEFTTGERIARGADGKKYYVPENTTYEEWKKSFVDGDKSSVEELRNDAEFQEKAQNRRAEWMKKHTNENVEKETVSNDSVKEQIQFDWKGNDEKHTQQQKIISDLSNEYNTRLQKVTVGAKQAAGDVDMFGATMRLSDSYEHTAIHEFAHTLANSKADKYGLTHDSDFWKEIKKIRREYHKDVDKSADVSRWISSYEHSSKSVDEFFAEAFTQAKMSELGLELPAVYGTDLTYSNKVLDVVDKYFKKPVVNAQSYGIMKLSDEELGAITRYKSFDSYIINDALRNTDDITKLSSEQQKVISLLDKALSKTPTYSGDLVRTVNFSDWPDAEEKTKKFIEGFTKGNKIRIPQYWSTSSKAGYDDTAEIQIFIENAEKGRDIKAVGLDESEVLYERNSEFIVLEKMFVNGKWNVLLKEI